MAEYIRKDILLEVLHEGREIMFQDSEGRTPVSLEGIIDLIKEIPTADVVEVVRCKDCEYWQDNNNGYPHEECRWGKDETPDTDDYCSYGKKVE